MSKIKMQHDKHTYYFEKYLRKEMSRIERDAFEKKLNADEAFKADFDKYALNHDSILKEELEEYYNEEIIPTKPKNYSWLLVLFSVLGLVLLIDYYANQKYANELKQNQTYKEEIVDRFNNAFVEPFKKISFKKGIKSLDTVYEQLTFSADSQDDKDSLPENQNKIDSSLIEGKIIDQFQQLMREKNIESNVKDIFLTDSLMVVIDLEKFKEKFKVITNSTDSALSDSLTTRLSLQSLTKQNNANKPLFVEFWQSLVGFNGYQFTGKKLVLYGVWKPYDIFILKQNNLFILHSKLGETPLQADNQLHKFED
ncbi:MAG: hypothetical protein ACEQSR_03175 [Candidatus Methylacidiphilales bacterium]